MTDHDLDKLLAEVAGVSVVFTHDAWWVIIIRGEDKGEYFDRTWTPRTDHNQMALVKAGLRNGGIWYQISWGTDIEQHEAFVREEDGYELYNHNDINELRAFAEAVAKMKAAQGRALGDLHE